MAGIDTTPLLGGIAYCEGQEDHSVRHSPFTPAAKRLLCSFLWICGIAVRGRQLPWSILSPFLEAFRRARRQPGDSISSRLSNTLRQTKQYRTIAPECRRRIKRTKDSGCVSI